MAATITVISKLQVAETPDSVSLGGASQQFTQAATGARIRQNDQSIPTSSEALDIGDLTYPLYVQIENLDPTNYVDVALDNANAANGPRLLPAGGTLNIYCTAILYLKANTGACIVRALMVKP